MEPTWTSHIFCCQQYLIEHDVDLDQGDGHMVRPLHLAAVTNHLNIAKLLMDKGANPTKQDNDGDVPLHWAATKGHMEVNPVAAAFPADTSISGMYWKRSASALAA